MCISPMMKTSRVTALALNFFGAVATLEGLRPLLDASPAPRAVAVSSIAALRPPQAGIVDACLKRDELAAVTAGKEVMAAGKRGHPNALPDAVQAPLDFYGQRQVRAASLVPQRREQARMGRRGNPAERGCAGLLRHAGGGVCAVQSREPRGDGAHDTAARSLSRRAQRGRSHSCLVRRPGEFAN